MERTIIVCDHCGGENVTQTVDVTERRMTMTHYIREFSTYSTLAYNPKKYKLTCKDCGHTVIFKK